MWSNIKAEIEAVDNPEKANRCCNSMYTINSTNCESRLVKKETRITTIGADISKEAKIHPEII